MDAGEAIDIANAAYLKAVSRLLRLFLLAIGIAGFVFAARSSSLRTAVILYAVVGVLPVVIGYVWGRVARR